MNDVKAVVLAQEYIKAHHTDMEFSVENVCSAVGYSRRQLDRLFQKHMSITLYEYINAVLLSESAAKLVDSDNTVIDVALDYHYQSHEGYTRSFAKHFSITPSEYRKHKIAIPIFTQHPANHYYILKEGQTMDATSICMVTPVNRPKRKLIYLTSHSATDYLSYCEEIGCDWEGLLNSIPEKFDTAALIDLPDFLHENGTSKIASGVEVPLDYEKPLPDGYKIAELQSVQCFTSKVNLMRIPTILASILGKCLRRLKTTTLNATAINTQQVLLQHSISVQSLKSEQELLFLLRA